MEYAEWIVSELELIVMMETKTENAEKRKTEKKTEKTENRKQRIRRKTENGIRKTDGVDTALEAEDVCVQSTGVRSDNCHSV